MSAPNWRSRMAEQVAAGRELVVLADGPWAHRWCWADELSDMQRAARRYPPVHPSGELRNYHRTTQQIPHPDEPELTGTAYRYHAPGHARTNLSEEGSS